MARNKLDRTIALSPRSKGIEHRLQRSEASVFAKRNIGIEPISKRSRAHRRTNYVPAPAMKAMHPSFSWYSEPLSDTPSHRTVHLPKCLICREEQKQNFVALTGGD